mgnify:CR=1 FL=1
MGPEDRCRRPTAVRVRSRLEGAVSMTIASPGKGASGAGRSRRAPAAGVANPGPHRWTDLSCPTDGRRIEASAVGRAGTVDVVLFSARTLRASRLAANSRAASLRWASVMCSLVETKLSPALLETVDHTWLAGKWRLVDAGMNSWCAAQSSSSGTSLSGSLALRSRSHWRRFQ